MTTALADAKEIRPQAGPQEEFLSSSVDICIYGGAAGGGKTFGLLMEPLYHITNPGFGAVIFRRTFPQIEREGGMWDESYELYPHARGRAAKSEMAWYFPSGAKVAFAHMQYPENVDDWRGSQIPLIEFDQLEEFTERQFFYMLSRNRSTCGVSPYIRATVNPDPDSWVARFISWWIDQDTGMPIQERAGVVRWLARNSQEWLWAGSKQELLDEHPELEPEQPKSATFIPSSLADNPILMQRDPGYRANLLAQDYVDRARLLDGNWKVRREAGKVFNRSWMPVVDAVPAGGYMCLGFDLAATEKKIAGDDPDYSAGVLAKLVDGVIYILDSQAVRVGPASVAAFVLNLTKQASLRAEMDGAEFMVRWEREPAGAGKRDNLQTVRMLAGYNARGLRPSGDKVTRIKPLAAQALAGNVRVVAGSWTEGWLQHMHAFPDGPHDDTADATEVATRTLLRIMAQGTSLVDEDTAAA